MGTCFGDILSIHRIRNATLHTSRDQAHALAQTHRHTKMVKQGERYADLNREGGDVVNICQSSQSVGKNGTHPIVSLLCLCQWGVSCILAFYYNLFVSFLITRVHASWWSDSSRPILSYYPSTWVQLHLFFWFDLQTYHGPVRCYPTCFDQLSGCSENVFFWGKG